MLRPMSFAEIAALGPPFAKPMSGIASLLLPIGTVPQSIGLLDDDCVKAGDDIAPGDSVACGLHPGERRRGAIFLRRDL